ncbi:BID domain-containing T4SS effector [Bartonella sp. CB178]|uniref:BID domain-containing T4SS effector n=1 Tax=Bartonella sp. CB178 TaxID=3112255 RepID=UPI00300DD9CE
MKKIQQQRTFHTNLSSTSDYCYPGTDVLKNKYSIKNRKALRRQCARDLKVALSDLHDIPVLGPADSKYLKEIHSRLYKNSFEWAGVTRDQIFTFSDGSEASMPVFTKAGADSKFFATGGEVSENLQSLDQFLKSSHYLQGLSRKDFVNNAVRMFILTRKTNPFVDGNKQAIAVFFQCLAGKAGHYLDFSLTSQKRVDIACDEAIKNSDFRLINGVFNDISEPQRIVLLRESIEQMRQCNIARASKRIVLVAEEGTTYAGSYLGSGDNGITIRVGDIFVAVPKDNFLPEQIKSFRLGDEVRVTILSERVLRQSFITEENVIPLTRDEVVAKIERDPRVQLAMSDIRGLARIVYGNHHALEEKIENLKQNPELGREIARGISENPESISRLNGRVFLGCFKNSARRVAEEGVERLSEAITRCADAALQVKTKTIVDHQTEQERCRQRVYAPSEELRGVLMLPEKARKLALENSLKLQRELMTLIKSVNSRLSAEECEAVGERNYKALAKSLGTSVRKAEEIAKIYENAERTRQEMGQCSSRVQVEKPQHSKTMAMAS